MVLCQAPSKFYRGSSPPWRWTHLARTIFVRCSAKKLDCQSYLGVHLATRAVHMRLMMGSFSGAI